MYNHQNYLFDLVEGNISIQSDIKLAIEKVFNSATDYFYKNEEKNRKAVIIQGDLHDYLFYDNNNKISVYQSNDRQTAYGEPFGYSLKSMSSDDGAVYLEGFILSAKYKMSIKEKEEHKLVMEVLKKLEKVNQLAKSKNNIEKLTSIPTNFYNFLLCLSDKKLIENNYSKSLFEDIGYKNLDSFDVEDYIIKFEYLMKVCKTEKFTAKNPYVYNDCDNTVYRYKDGFFMSDQNITFFIFPTGNKSWSVYNYSNEYKLLKNRKDLLSALKENNIDRLDSITLEIENGEMKYVNFSDMYSFDLDIESSVSNIAEDTSIAMTTDVDIYSYQYQRAYYMNKYSMSEGEFLAQAFLTYGGGFDYDKKSGTFRDRTINYSKKIDVNAPTEDKPLKHISYCLTAIIPEITHLSEDWLNGVKYLVNRLKTDRPTYTVPSNDTNAVDKAIEGLNGIINKVENKSKRKNKP